MVERINCQCICTRHASEGAHGYEARYFETKYSVTPLLERFRRVQKSSLTPLTNLSKMIAMVDSPVTRLSKSGIVSRLLTVGDIHSIYQSWSSTFKNQETCHGSLNHGISQTHGFVTLTV